MPPHCHHIAQTLAPPRLQQQQGHQQQGVDSFESEGTTPSGSRAASRRPGTSLPLPLPLPLLLPLPLHCTSSPCPPPPQKKKN